MSNGPSSREQTAKLIIAAFGCDFPTAARLAMDMTAEESDTINRSSKNLRHVEQLVTRVRDRIGVVDAAIEFAEQVTDAPEPDSPLATAEPTVADREALAEPVAPDPDISPEIPS